MGVSDSTANFLVDILRLIDEKALEFIIWKCHKNESSLSRPNMTVHIAVAVQYCSYVCKDSLSSRSGNIKQ